MIRINGLNKYYNKGKANENHVLNQIDLSLPDKGMVAIFGKSGCGKTTLLNVIGGLDRFERGSISVDGKSVRKNADLIRNRYMGYIFQNYNLHKNLSCYENISHALRLCGIKDSSLIDERVTAALEYVGMEKYKKRTPDTLSGGQQQRIAIARAIVKNPKIILADEPTGNLDEENTVKIMDLLKAISKDHLVLLVTHEADLVDYYCDTVIELTDGKVTNIKNNASADGLQIRGKNDIYLGELEKSEIGGTGVSVEYYGGNPAETVKLKIINDRGKIYLKIDTPKVTVLDETSEIKLKEGVYKQKANGFDDAQKVDMSKLPAIEGARFGRLFGFWSSVKSGYNVNFKDKKRGKKILRSCMCLFASVVVFMCAVFGTSISDYFTVSDSYNHSTFYVHTPDEAVSDKLNGAVGDRNSAIDYVRLCQDYQIRDDNIYFGVGSFESFKTQPYSTDFSVNAVLLDTSLVKGLKLVEGRITDLAEHEIVITKRVADDLIEKSSFGYLKTYRDLLGLKTSGLNVGGMNLCVAGIVDSQENAIYMTPLSMAKYILRNYQSGYVLDELFGIDVAAGEIVYVERYGKPEGEEKLSVGDTVKINGRDLKISQIKRIQSDYLEWIKENNKNIVEDRDAFFNGIIKKNNPNLNSDSQEYYDLLAQAQDKYYFDYLDYLYSAIDEFLKEEYTFNKAVYLWMYFEKGVDAVKFDYMMDGDAYYLATEYKKANGSYPAVSQIFEKSDLNALRNAIDEAYRIYEDEFYKSDYGLFNNPEGLNSFYLVSEEDYIAFSKCVGETSINQNVKVEIYDEYYGDMSYESVQYTLVHSTDPVKTESWLKENMSLSEGMTGMPALVTPDSIFDDLIEQKLESIIIGIVTMVIILVVMSICMYFIMRSALMSRIKEVGVYRAIGVSKKNLIFKFFVESVVLTTLSVFVGYLLSSVFIFACLGISPLVERIFFYPLWMAGAVLVILYVISLIFGVMPIMSLLRKTPSEILSKYDI